MANLKKHFKHPDGSTLCRKPKKMVGWIHTYWTSEVTCQKCLDEIGRWER